MVQRRILENELRMEGCNVPNYPANPEVKDYEFRMQPGLKAVRKVLTKFGAMGLVVSRIRVYLRTG